MSRILVIGGAVLVRLVATASRPWAEELVAATEVEKAVACGGCAKLDDNVTSSEVQLKESRQQLIEWLDPAMPRPEDHPQGDGPMRPSGPRSVDTAGRG